MPTTTTPSINQLKRAVALAEHIQQLETELATLLENSSAASTSTGAAAPARRGRRRGKLSADGLARIKAAQQERWARLKGMHASSEAGASSGKPKNGRRKTRRSIGPEARAKMAEAAKKRWAKIKKANG